MDVARVGPIAFTERLDAEFYRPVFLENQNVLASLGSSEILGDVCNQVKLGYTGPVDSYYGDDGALFLSSKNIAEGKLLVEADTDRIRLDIHNGKLSATKALVGDLLFSRTGSVGKAAVLHDGNDLYNFAAHLFAIRPKKGIDADYLAAFFNSNRGRLQSLRLQRGTIIQGLSIYDMPKMLVPLFKDTVQYFVGNKVRIANQLRVFANACERQFRRSLVTRFPHLDIGVRNDFKHGRASASDLNGSLNPGAFNPDRLHVRSYLKSNCGRRVSEFASVVATVTSEYQPGDFYLGLDSIGSSLGTISPSTIEVEDVTGSVRILSEGPVISKLRPYLNKVAYIPPHLSNAFGSTELLCVHAHDPALNWYLCGVLQLTSTVRQLNPVSTGSTHPRVTREDILDCYVPWIDDAANVGLLLADAQRAYFLSDKLLVAAKLLVEALIDGTVTEQEISDAQTRVEQGDQTGDREVLGRLCEGGIDASDTRPLFVDLDGYYETLRMAEQALADGGDE
jgi:type I restriction enzyme, S subunit